MNLQKNLYFIYIYILYLIYYYPQSIVVSTSEFTHVCSYGFHVYVIFHAPCELCIAARWTWGETKFVFASFESLNSKFASKFASFESLCLHRTVHVRDIDYTLWFCSVFILVSNIIAIIHTSSINGNRQAFASHLCHVAAVLWKQ